MDSLLSRQKLDVNPPHNKRSNQHLAEEGLPSDAGSGSVDAAGLLPVHQRKARRLDDCKGTMDVELNTGYTGASTPTLDGPDITEDSPAYADFPFEIPENVRSPTIGGARSTARAGSSGRRSYPLSQQKVIHHTTSNEALQKSTTSVRSGKTEERITGVEYGTPASRLSNDVIQERPASQLKPILPSFHAASLGSRDSSYADVAGLHSFHNRRYADRRTVGPESTSSLSSRIDENNLSDIDITAMPPIPESAESTEDMEPLLRPDAIHADNVQRAAVSLPVFHSMGKEGNTVPSPAGVEVKLEQEEVTIAFPTSASDLYNKLVTEGHVGYPDAITAWYDALGLPCYPDRVEVEPKSNVETRRSKGEHYTASSLDQRTLKKYCRWGFGFIVAVNEDPSQLSAKRAYRLAFQYPENGEGPSTHNFDERPRARLDEKGEPRLLECMIENHLAQEVYRMQHAQMVLPIEWEEEATVALPLNYIMPERYEKCLSATKKFDERVATPIAVHATSETEGSQSDGQFVIVQNKETPRARTARRAVEKLCRQYNIGKNPEADSERTTKIVEAFHKEWKRMNLPFHKHRALRDALSSIIDFELEEHIQRDSRENIQANDTRYRAGDATSNENTTSLEEYPPHIIAGFLRYAMDEERRPSEVEIEKTVGALLRNVVTGEGMPISDGVALNFPPHLRPVGSSPKPDLYVRGSVPGWAEEFASLYPVLFAGEGKRLEKIDVKDICAQLATAFHGTLIILILYYLDTRKDLHSPLPPWLFLYGIEYTQCGVNICAYYPSYEFTGETGQWTLQSRILTQGFMRLFQVHNAMNRMRFLAVLYRIRSHCEFVLERLQKWDRAEDVLRTLLKST